jgi:serralysin
MPVVTDFTALIFDNPASRCNIERDEGNRVVVTYSFDDLVSEFPDESEFADKIIGDFTTEFSDAGQQAIVRFALAKFEVAAGIRFEELDDGGMLQFVDATSITRNGNVVSFASVPVTTATQGSIGHVVMNQAHFPLYSGTAGFRILLHEIGHTLGLDHSDDGNDMIFGNDANYEIDGGIGNDTLTGGSGVDRLNGGTDADTMTGCDGNDI